MHITHFIVHGIWNKSENENRSYKIFVTNVHFTEVIKLFELSIIHYTNNPQFLVGSLVALIMCV